MFNQHQNEHSLTNNYSLPLTRGTTDKQVCKYISGLQGARLAEEGHEMAAEVQLHDLPGAADEGATDEYRRHRRALAHHASERPLHILSLGVLAHLVHRRAHAQLRKEPRHRVGHAAGARPKDHHRALRRHRGHPLRHC